MMIKVSDTIHFYAVAPIYFVSPVRVPVERYYRNVGYFYETSKMYYEKA
jgi:hypothetical protein